MTFALMGIIVLVMLTAGLAQQRFVSAYRAHYGVGRTASERLRDLTDPGAAWRHGRVDAGLIWRHHLVSVEHEQVERARRQMVLADLLVAAGLVALVLSGPRLDFGVEGVFTTVATGLLVFWVVALIVGLAQHWPRVWLVVCGAGIAAAGMVLVFFSLLA